MTERTDLKYHVALLAPVPLCHLESAMDIIGETGKVAFGSMAFELFRGLNDRKKRQDISVYIYATHAEAVTLPQASWRADYLRSVDSRFGRHPDGEDARPPSARQEDNPGPNAWACFWEVTNLRPLSEDEIVPTHEFFGFGNAKPFKKGFVPRGPLIVHIP